MAAGCDVNPGFRGPPDNSDRLLLNDTPSVARSTVNWMDLRIPLYVFFSPLPVAPAWGGLIEIGMPWKPYVYHHIDLYRIWHSKISPSFSHIFPTFLFSFNFLLQKKGTFSPQFKTHRNARCKSAAVERGGRTTRWHLAKPKSGKPSINGAILGMSWEYFCEIWTLNIDQYLLVICHFVEKHHS